MEEITAYKLPDIEDFKKVCNQKGGIISNIAAAFVVERGTVYDWCEKYPEYKEALTDSRERFIDIAEGQLQLLVKGIPLTEKDENGKDIFAGWKFPPSEKAILYTLSTIGRKRGYTERSEFELSGGINQYRPVIKLPDGQFIEI